MAATWGEIATDAPWSPWLLKQYRATFEGHDNGEAVAINATTINDPANPAARWKNLGGGGAGSWLAADGSPIASAPDTGFTFAKPISGAGASFSGAVSVASLAASGAVTAASVTASGAVSGASGSFSGAVSGGTGAFVGAVAAGSVVSTGPISGTTGTFSGFVSAVTATVVGAGAGNDQALFLKHNAGVGAFSLGATSSVDPSLILKDASGDEVARFNPTGSTYALDVNTPSPRSTNAARFTGDVLITTDLGVRAINATGGYSGTTGSFSGAVSVASLTASGGISAGASSAFTGGVSVISGGLSVLGGGGSFVGSVSATGGMSAGASSSFTGGVSIVSGGLTVIAGGADVTGNSRFRNNLQVDGTLTATVAGSGVDTSAGFSVAGGVLTLPAGGGLTTPTLTFAGDTNMGIYRSAADVLELVTNGARGIQINASQEVGIGLTAQAGYRLFIFGDLRWDGTTSGSATAGGSGAIPGNPAGWIKVGIAGSNFKMPFWNT